MAKENDEYKKWLKETDTKDSKEAKKWFDCPEEKRSEFIKKHKTWWDNH